MKTGCHYVSYAVQDKMTVAKTQIHPENGSKALKMGHWDAFVCAYALKSEPNEKYAVQIKTCFGQEW